MFMTIEMAVGATERRGVSVGEEIQEENASRRKAKQNIVFMPLLTKA
jgi:hypothetical protein